MLTPILSLYLHKTHFLTLYTFFFFYYKIHSALNYTNKYYCIAISLMPYSQNKINWWRFFILLFLLYFITEF